MIRGFYTFPKGYQFERECYSKNKVWTRLLVNVNVTQWLKFELNYFEVAVQHLSSYAKRNSKKKKKKKKKKDEIEKKEKCKK